MTRGVQELMLEVERVRDACCAALYADRDADAALAVLAPDAGLLHLPVGTAAAGTDELRRFLVQDLLPGVPDDLAFRRLSRTGDRWRVAQEDLVSFTHDREMPWLLPGVPATGRTVQVLAVSVVTVQRSRVTMHRTLWDHAGLLSQLALDLASVPLPGGHNHERRV